MAPDPDPSASRAADAPDLLTVEHVRARYHLRDARAARRIAREAGAYAIAGRLYVRRDALDRWEASRQLEPRWPSRPSTREQRPTSPRRDLRALTPGWWREP